MMSKMKKLQILSIILLGITIGSSAIAIKAISAYVMYNTTYYQQIGNTFQIEANDYLENQFEERWNRKAQINFEEMWENGKEIEDYITNTNGLISVVNKTDLTENSEWVESKALKIIPTTTSSSITFYTEDKFISEIFDISVVVNINETTGGYSTYLKMTIDSHSYWLYLQTSGKTYGRIAINNGSGSIYDSYRPMNLNKPIYIHYQFDFIKNKILCEAYVVDDLNQNSSLEVDLGYSNGTETVFQLVKSGIVNENWYIYAIDSNHVIRYSNQLSTMMMDSSLLDNSYYPERCLEFYQTTNQQEYATWNNIETPLYLTETTNNYFEKTSLDSATVIENIEVEKTEMEYQQLYPNGDFKLWSNGTQKEEILNVFDELENEIPYINAPYDEYFNHNANYNNHDDVLLIDDTDLAGTPNIGLTFGWSSGFSTNDEVYISFWMNKNNTDYTTIVLGTNIGNCLYLSFGANVSTYNGTGYPIYAGYDWNAWNFIQIYMNIDTLTNKLWINNSLIVENMQFRGTPTSLAQLYFSTGYRGVINQTVYFDALYYGIEPKYIAYWCNYPIENIEEYDLEIVESTLPYESTLIYDRNATSWIGLQYNLEIQTNIEFEVQLIPFSPNIEIWFGNQTKKEGGGIAFNKWDGFNATVDVWNGTGWEMTSFNFSSGNLDAIYTLKVIIGNGVYSAWIDGIFYSSNPYGTEILNQSSKYSICKNYEYSADLISQCVIQTNESDNKVYGYIGYVKWSLPNQLYKNWGLIKSLKLFNPAEESSITWNYTNANLNYENFMVGVVVDIPKSGNWEIHLQFGDYMVGITTYSTRGYKWFTEWNTTRQYIWHDYHSVDIMPLIYTDEIEFGVGIDTEVSEYPFVQLRRGNFYQYMVYMNQTVEFETIIPEIRIQNWNAVSNNSLISDTCIFKGVFNKSVEYIEDWEQIGYLPNELLGALSYSWLTEEYIYNVSTIAFPITWNIHGGFIEQIRVKYDSTFQDNGKVSQAYTTQKYLGFTVYNPTPNTLYVQTDTFEEASTYQYVNTFIDIPYSETTNNNLTYGFSISANAFRDEIYYIEFSVELKWRIWFTVVETEDYATLMDILIPMAILVVIPFGLSKPFGRIGGIIGFVLTFIILTFVGMIGMIDGILIIIVAIIFALITMRKQNMVVE